VRETIRVVTHDLLDAPAAREYLGSLDAEPRVLHPLAASPFTFGIVTSSFGDSVVMDDRASMVEALHERVLSLLGETDDTPLHAPAAESAAVVPPNVPIGKTAAWREAQADERRSPIVREPDQPLLLDMPGIAAPPRAKRKAARR
jgi:hypothetical protein